MGLFLCLMGNNINAWLEGQLWAQLHSVSATEVLQISTRSRSLKGGRSIFYDLGGIPLLTVAYFSTAEIVASKLEALAAVRSISKVRRHPTPQCICMHV